MQALEILKEAIEKVKQSDTFQNLCKEYNRDCDEIYLMPIAFKENLPVSARTQHAMIFLNKKLLETPEKIPMYILHESTHFFQQTSGDKPTSGSNDDNYLYNEFEQEAFQNQAEFIDEHHGEEAAEKYIDKLLDHHEVDSKEEKKDLKDTLLENVKTAGLLKVPEQLALDFKKDKEILPEVTKEEREKFLKDLEEGNLTPKFKRKLIHKLPDFDKEYRKNRIKEILEKIDESISKKARLEIPSDFPISELEEWVADITASRVVKHIKHIIKNFKEHKNYDTEISKIQDFYFDEGGKLDLDNVPEKLKTHIICIKNNDNSYNLDINGKIYTNISYDEAEDVLWNKNSGFLPLLIEDFLKINKKVDTYKNHFIDLYNLLNKCKQYNINNNVKNIETKVIPYEQYNLIINYSINVNNFPKEYNTSKALYQFGVNKIFITYDPTSILNTDDFKKALDLIKKDLHHEIIHFMQDYLDKQNELPIFSSGKPTRKAKSNEYLDQSKPHTFKQHTLDDMEFFTRLNDEILKFNSLYKDVPESIKILAANYFTYSIQNMRAELPKLNLKAIPLKQFKIYKDYLQRSKFFKILLNNSINKWKLAVKEFTKAVL